METQSGVVCEVPEVVVLPTSVSYTSNVPALATTDTYPSMDSLMHSPIGDGGTPPYGLTAMDSIDGSMEDMFQGSEGNSAKQLSHNGDARHIDNGSFAALQVYLASIANNATMLMQTPDVNEMGIVVQRPSGATSAADFSDCFRLYFGSNIMTFPFVVLLGGYLGTVAFTIPLAVLLQAAVVILLDAKKVVLHDVMKDHSKHVELNSYMALVRALWSKKVSGAFHDELRVVSWWPVVIQCVVAFAQFGSCCTFTVLVARNLEALLELTSTQSTAAACCILASLQSLYRGDDVKKLFAFVNNGCLLAAAVILVFATAASDMSDGGVTTPFPISLPNLLILLPVVTGRISPALFAVDVEASLAARVISRTRKRDLKRRRLANRARRSGAVITSQLDDADEDLPVDHHATLERTTFILNRFRRFSIRSSIVSLFLLLGFGELIYSRFKDRTNAVIALSLPDGPVKVVLLIILCVGLSATGAINVAAIGGVLDTLQLHKRQWTWHGLLLGLPLSVVRKLRTHKSNDKQSPRPTTPAVALPPASRSQATATAAHEGTAQNTPPQMGSHALTESPSTMLEVLPIHSDQSASHAFAQTVEYYVVRAVLFVLVFLVLMTVPFFDLIAALAGSIGFASFSFIVPAVLEVQAMRRKIDATAELDETQTSTATQPREVAMIEAFHELPLSRKLICLSLIVVGVFVFVSGTSNAVVAALHRQ